MGMIWRVAARARGAVPRTAVAGTRAVQIFRSYRRSRQGRDEYEYEDAVDDGEEREEWGRSTYDSQGLDGDGESWTKGGRAGLEEYSDEEDTSVDENSSSTMYLQLAACLCVVVWASALAAGTFYAAPDGRRDDAQENLRLI